MLVEVGDEAVLQNNEICGIRLILCQNFSESCGTSSKFFQILDRDCLRKKTKKL